MSKLYAALIEDTYTVEGDERSRTNPGHGYPAHTIEYVRVKKFDDRDEMERWVKEQESRAYSKDKYEIIEYLPMTVKTSTTISVDVQLGKTK